MTASLVTGGAGFLGSHLCDELLRRGHRVTCVDNLETGSLANDVANPNEFTLLELAEAVLEVTGSRSEVVFEALPTDDPQVRQPDITLAGEILGWQPEIDLRDGLRRPMDQSGIDMLVGGPRQCGGRGPNTYLLEPSS